MHAKFKFGGALGTRKSPKNPVKPLSKRQIPEITRQPLIIGIFECIIQMVGFALSGRHLFRVLFQDDPAFEMKASTMSTRSGRHFLQIPGPTNVPDRILRAMDRPTIDHRGPAFAVLTRKSWKA